MVSKMTFVRADEGVEGLSKKENGLMDLDNSVMIAGGKGYIRGLNGKRKNTKKIKSHLGPRY